MNKDEMRRMLYELDADEFSDEQLTELQQMMGQ